ncbi:MAG: SDR family oxidoreductase [Gemmatimonadetes bacterium]|nr:SDR family oxidoreductase [Gemmatimonadota bacterium]
MKPGPVSRALILGAHSDIALALAHALAASGTDLVLAARNHERLEPVASDLRLRHTIRVDLLEFDVHKIDEHDALADRVRQQAGPWQLALSVVGDLGDQTLARSETTEAHRVLTTSFTSLALCLAHLADDLEKRKEGGIICLTSVAGDRGRQSNYTYGAAKAGLGVFLAGLRNRLAASGVHVMTVKPGFVDTPMTQGMEGLFLVASPERVAGDILRAWRHGRNEIYTPWFWRWIMALIRAIPEPIFRRLSL